MTFAIVLPTSRAPCRAAIVRIASRSSRSAAGPRASAMACSRYLAPSRKARPPAIAAEASFNPRPSDPAPRRSPESARKSSARLCRRVRSATSSGSKATCCATRSARAISPIAAIRGAAASKENESASEAAGSGRSASAMRALMPNAPPSPTKSPVASGPWWRKKGVVPGLASAPVPIDSPVPVITSSPSTLSAAVP